MLMSRADQLAQVLDEFLASSPDIEAAAVVSADGLPMASALPPQVEEDRLAAMSAALLLLGERAASGLGKGDLAQVLVEGANGYVVLMAAGPHAVLVAVASTGARAGLLLFEMKRMAERVTTLMREVPVDVAEGIISEEGTVQEPSEDTSEPESSISGWQ
jgi:predicted regulator of Ras-like GTPase activity (Roadblock/LC7/MglB family)